jgi:hypothetical protein
LSSLAILLVVTVLTIYAAMPIHAMFWHLVHGNSARCGEFTVPVPRGWWPTDGGCTLVTPSRPYHPRSQDLAQIFFNLAAAPSASASQWSQATLDQNQSKGDPLRHVEQLTVAGRPTVCFEYDAPVMGSNPIIACNVERRMVVTLFYDNPKFKAAFYEVLRGVR